MSQDHSLDTLRRAHRWYADFNRLFREWHTLHKDTHFKWQDLFHLAVEKSLLTDMGADTFRAYFACSAGHDCTIAGDDGYYHLKRVVDNRHQLLFISCDYEAQFN